MKPDADEILFAIAKNRQVRVRPIKSFDPNVCKFDVDSK